MSTSLLAFAASLVLAAAPVPPGRKMPNWYDPMLAGYVLKSDRTHLDKAVYDPQTKYYVFRGSECDGGEVTLVLTQNSSVVTDFGFKIPWEKNLSPSPGAKAVVRKALPNLATGKGIRIGDSDRKIVETLGAPSRIEHDADGETRLVYEKNLREKSHDGDGPNIAADYGLKGGKLVEIQFSFDGE